MKLIKRSFIALIALAAVACSKGGTEPDPMGTVRGVVRDNTNAPIANVSLQLYREGRTARFVRSDGSGNFSFTRIEAGTWQLEFTIPSNYTLPSLQKNPTPVEVEAGATIDVNVSLSRKGPTGPLIPIGPTATN